MIGSAGKCNRLLNIKVWARERIHAGVTHFAVNHKREGSTLKDGDVNARIANDRPEFFGDRGNQVGLRHSCRLDRTNNRQQDLAGLIDGALELFWLVHLKQIIDLHINAVACSKDVLRGTSNQVSCCRRTHLGSEGVFINFNHIDLAKDRDGRGGVLKVTGSAWIHPAVVITACQRDSNQQTECPRQPSVGTHCGAN